MKSSRYHRTERNFYYRPKRKRRRLKPLYKACLAGCGALFLVCVWKLGAYGWDYLSSRRLSAELRSEYHAQATATPEAQSVMSATPAPTTWPVVETTASADASKAPVASATWLMHSDYPNNPFLRINERFQKLRRRNSDIVGWVTIDELLDEAVVQRDNSYYLRRDYLGYHNTNGAIFLEESIGLRSRPSALLLYGHNMKTGSMFGCLRNYETLSFYKKNPYITFDTIYEDGRYVIFSVAQVNIKPTAKDHAAFYQLPSCSDERKAQIISDLCRLSMFNCPIDVQPEDQLLLLITCMGDDDERRVVAARRLRDGETEESVAASMRNLRKR